MKDNMASSMLRRRLRYDPAPGRGADGDCAERGLLDLFGEWIRSKLGDRRSSPRHQTDGFWVWLGWWKGGRQFLASSAELVNISRGGALVRIPSPIPPLREVWVCLDVPEKLEDCVLATVLDVTATAQGKWTARLEFEWPCPHPFFDAAVCGIENAMPGATLPPGIVQTHEPSGSSTAPPSAHERS